MRALTTTHSHSHRYKGYTRSHSQEQHKRQGSNAHQISLSITSVSISPFSCIPIIISQTICTIPTQLILKAPRHSLLYSQAILLAFLYICGYRHIWINGCPAHAPACIIMSPISLLCHTFLHMFKLARHAQVPLFCSMAPRGPVLGHGYPPHADHSSPASTGVQ